MLILAQAVSGVVPLEPRWATALLLELVATYLRGCLVSRPFVAKLCDSPEEVDRFEGRK